jgi:hypothetical protein
LLPDPQQICHKRVSIKLQSAGFSRILFSDALPSWIEIEDGSPFALAGIWKETDAKTGETR